MSKKASVDLEFKAYMTGYNELEKKVDAIIAKVDGLSSASGDINISSKRGGDTTPSEEKKATSRFTKMLVKLGGATGAIMLFTKMISSVVKQSQVYASIIQLIFTPFVMMVNFMLLPVLKWLVPIVTEWLQWTIENKPGFEALGDVLTDIGDVIKDVEGWDTNPLKVFIETLTGLATQDPNADGWTRFANAISSAGNLSTSIFDPLLSAFQMGWVADVAKGIIDSFANSFKEMSKDGTLGEKILSAVDVFTDTLVESIKNILVNSIKSIPIIGESAGKWVDELLTDPHAATNGLEALREPLLPSIIDHLSKSTKPVNKGVDLDSIKPLLDISNLRANNDTNTNWGLMLWDSNFGTGDVRRFNLTETSLLKSKIGPL